MIARWDAATQSYQPVSGDDRLEAGQAYWIYSARGGVSISVAPEPGSGDGRDSGRRASVRAATARAGPAAETDADAEPQMGDSREVATTAGGSVTRSTGAPAGTLAAAGDDGRGRAGERATPQRWSLEIDGSGQRYGTADRRLRSSVPDDEPLLRLAGGRKPGR